MKGLIGLATIASATHPLNLREKPEAPVAARPSLPAGLADIQNLIADFEPELDLTKFTKREFLVEHDQNQILPVLLEDNGFQRDLLQNHGHWCFGLYGASGKIMKGLAVDSLDTACKTWRAQTRCLMERKICTDLIDDYRLKIFADANYQCEQLSGECGYEKCIIDLNASLALLGILDTMSEEQMAMIGVEASQDHQEIVRKIEVEIESKPKVFLKTGAETQQTPKVADIFTKAKHQCCRMDAGVYKMYDSTSQLCVDHPFPAMGEKMRICEKQTILPSYARVPWVYKNNEDAHGAHLAIDGEINDYATSGKIQRTQVGLNNWLYIDYAQTYSFDMVEIYTPVNCCAKASNNLTVKILPSEHACTYIPTGEESTPGDMETRIKPGEILKFDCGGKFGQYIKIEKAGRGLITMEEIKAFKKSCY